jgi:hypothetical protein
MGGGKNGPKKIIPLKVSLLVWVNHVIPAPMLQMGPGKIYQFSEERKGLFKIYHHDL